MKKNTIVMTCDSGSVMWEPVANPAAVDPRHHDTSDVIDGGFLLGARPLVREVRRVLDDVGIVDVVVAQPGLRYTFTEGRDTVADVVAAMVFAGDGRGLFNDAGNEVIAGMAEGGPRVVVLSEEEAAGFVPDEDDDTIYVIGQIIY